MNVNNDSNKYFKRLKSNDNNIENYYYKELNGLSDGTILNHLISISKLFETNKQRNDSWRTKNKDFKLNNNNINLFSEQDIKDFIDSDWWNNLSGGTKNNHLNRIKKYLKYSERNDLINLLPDKIRGQSKQLSKNDLITREELSQILKYSNSRYKALFMVLFEGALRIKEAINILRMDIRFNGGYAILKVRDMASKTYGRDEPLIESIPYLKAYLESNDFEPEDKLFDFSSTVVVNNYLNFIKKKLIKKYPKQWKGRKLFPHLFRHSRLTELARTKLNEAQIRKFAGWSADSSMPKIYFHLNDDDVIKILTDEVVEVPKLERKKPKICKFCNTENGHENIFCWNCGNVFNQEDKKQLAIEMISQPQQIEDLKTEMKEMKQMFRIIFSVLKETDKEFELSDDYKSFMEFMEEKAFGGEKTE
jgi:integrase